jgi:glycosyltransferase involved in cell wall biosynthesis
LITVFLFSYNHSSFIEQAVDSILAQVTSFSFKIIICDDCSSDTTQSIIKKYKKNFPDKISLILRKKNLGYQKSILSALKESETKYAAILEGDDFWTEPNKLQRQVDFLENNPDVSLCTHWVKTKDESGKKTHEDAFSGQIYPARMDKYFLFDPEKPNSPQCTGYHLLSWVFKSEIIKKIPHWIIHQRGFDDVFFVVLLQYGNCYCIPAFMGTYRINKSSSWAPLNDRIQSVSFIHYLFRIKYSFLIYRSRVKEILEINLKNFKNWPSTHIENKVLFTEIFKISLRDPKISLELFEFFICVWFYQIFNSVTSELKIKIGKYNPFSVFK